jgi:hypothetical protein
VGDDLLKVNQMPNIPKIDLYTPEIIPQELPPTEVSLDGPSSASAQDDISNSPFAQMFKGTVTKDELRQFINNCLYAIAHECKRAEASAKRASRKFLCAVTGKKYYD